MSLSGLSTAVMPEIFLGYISAGLTRLIGVEDREDGISDDVHDRLRAQAWTGRSA